MAKITRYLTRSEIIHEARSCSSPDDEFVHLADWLVHALHHEFPWLTTLRRRAFASGAIDARAGATEDDPHGLTAPMSPQYELASKAYHAALRSVIHGYDLPPYDV